jgi:hypothetical protein
MKNKAEIYQYASGLYYCRPRIVWKFLKLEFNEGWEKSISD